MFRRLQDVLKGNLELSPSLPAVQYPGPHAAPGPQSPESLWTKQNPFSRLSVHI